jgi:hypothetical protein
VSVMQKMVPTAAPPFLKEGKTSKFISFDSSNKEKEEDLALKFGKVAKDWGKDLKGLTEAYSSKKKLKEAVWSRFILKCVLGVNNDKSLRYYVEFVLVVNKLNCAKNWPLALAYAQVWLKQDKKATSSSLSPPKATLDAELLTNMELRLLKKEKC